MCTKTFRDSANQKPDNGEIALSRRFRRCFSLRIGIFTKRYGKNIRYNSSFLYKEVVTFQKRCVILYTSKIDFYARSFPFNT